MGCGQGIVKSSDTKAWSLIQGTGRTVGLIRGGGRLYACDQWSTTYRTATDQDPGSWSTVQPPAALPAGQGCAFLDYDAAHHVLYSSNIAAGIWRLVTQ